MWIFKLQLGKVLIEETSAKDKKGRSYTELHRLLNINFKFLYIIFK